MVLVMTWAIALPVSAQVPEPRFVTVEKLGPEKLADDQLAQAPAVAPSAQGDSLVINGVPAAVPWMLRDGQVGLADYGVSDHLGATLLSSQRFDRQPIQWFTAPGDTLELAAWVQGGYRFLDIAPLAQRHGWRIQPRAGSLEITTPPVQITALERQALPGGERLVLTLSGPTPFSLGASADTLTLTLGAIAPDDLLRQAIAAPAGTYLGALTAEALGSSTRLRASASHAPHAATQPNQIVVNIRPDSLVAHSIAWAPGLQWQQRYISAAGQSFPVYWLHIDPTQASLRPIWPDPTTAVGTAPMVATARRWQAAAAINAGFFNRNNQYPLGAARSGDRWVSGPILNRGVIGWNEGGEARIERLALRQTLTTPQGQSFAVQTLNSGYVQAGIGAYTTAWGATYRPILEGEILVTVVDDVVVAQQPAATVSPQGLAIPANGYLLALRSYATAARALPPGQRVTLTAEVLPSSLAPYPHLVGGGPLLIRDRTPVLDPALEQFSPAFAAQAAPRSAIGVTPTGDLLLVAVHHSPQGPGPTLSQLTQILLHLGATQALNLDGGSSASLYLGGRLINRPPGTAARVNNGIGVFY
jgi:hypothetical protein